MALVLQDRVKESSSSSGTGSVVLSGAFTGYRTFASCIPDGSTVYYCIHNLAVGSEGEWEVGYGTYTLSTTTLARTSVLSSSNAGSLVNFTSGANGLEVFITYPAEKAVYEEANGETLIDGGPITVVGSNVTALPTLPAELGKFVGNVDLFAQIYNYNQNSGTEASADFVAYNSDTDVNGSTFFVDMGINSPNYSSVDYPIFTPHSGYLFSYGDANTHPSTLFVGSGDNDVRIFAGGLDTNNTVATFNTDLSTDLAGALNVAGALDITGVTTLNALAYTAGNIAAAANNTVLVTKAYVDNATSTGIHIHEPVRVERGSNLNATYNNGTDGVGATLTNAGTQEALVIDGISLNVADRVLVYGQTTQTQNGVYVVTTVGDGSTNWVLTRASDADTYDTQDPNALGGGDYFFVQEGLTGAGESYVCTNEGTITFGTTAITFTQFSASPTYVGGTNINITGQTIALTGTVAPTNGGTGVNTVTTGDLLYGSASNTWSKLAAGTAYKSLVMNAGGTQVEWNAVALNQSGAVSGALPATNGGTAQTTYTLGDTLYSSAANTLAKLSGNTTTTKKYLQQQGDGTNSAAPSWQQVAAADISGLAASATTDTTNADNISSGTLANARTTASSSNGASTIVARDASGNFAAGTITATAFSGSGASLTSLNASAISAGTIANARTTGTSSGTADTLVLRDGSGNFSAGTITANLTGTASNATYATSAGTADTATSATTASTANALATGNNYQVNSLGVGTGASGTAGEIRATNNITAYYSDERLKTKIGSIENALDKVKQIETMVYHANETAVELGYDASKIEVGVTAQSVQRVQPEAVKPAPIDEKYLTVQYERLVPLLIEAIKELEAQVAELKAK